MRALGGLSILLLSLASVSGQDGNPFRVEIDLQQQTAFLIRGRGLVLESPISSGRYGHLTQTGSFKVLEKEVNHYSSIYGKIVDGNGKTIVADADVDMKVPRGGKFIPAPMRYFMRFHEADGMHAGYLPGYPASHGCVRDARAIGDCVLPRDRHRNSGYSFRTDASSKRILPHMAYHRIEECSHGFAGQPIQISTAIRSAFPRSLVALIAIQPEDAGLPFEERGS